MPTRKPIEAGQTMSARLFNDLNGIMSYPTYDNLSAVGRRFICSGLIIPVSLAALTTSLGGLLRWGVVDPTIRPGEERPSWLQQGRSWFYSALYWTQWLPGGLPPSLHALPCYL